MQPELATFEPTLLDSNAHFGSPPCGSVPYEISAQSDDCTPAIELQKYALLYIFSKSRMGRYQKGVYPQSPIKSIILRSICHSKRSICHSKCKSNKTMKFEQMTKIRVYSKVRKRALDSIIHNNFRWKNYPFPRPLKIRTHMRRRRLIL